MRVHTTDDPQDARKEEEEDLIEDVDSN